MATAAQRQASVLNGSKGGRPTSALAELRRKARAKATRLLCSETEESIRFLVWVRDNPNVALSDRVRCALELLSRGEVPQKSTTYAGTTDAEGEVVASPKLFVLGRFETNGNSNGNGNGNGHSNGVELGVEIEP